MTFEVKLNLIKDLHIYDVSNHIKFQCDQVLQKKIYKKKHLLP